MNSQVLKPCPFCGGAVQFHKDDDCDGCHYIECQGCKGMFDLATKADPENRAEELADLQNAIAVLWNRRATPAPIPDAAEGVEVVAWRWKTPIPKELGGSFAWSHASHWSTGPKDAQELMTVTQHERIVSALRDGGGVPSVQITGHLDEIDAPVWDFINTEARKLSPLTGSIDAYGLSRPNGAQPNGTVAVLWNGSKVHALAVTVRDGHNRTACVRVLAPLSKLETTTSQAGVGE